MRMLTICHQRVVVIGVPRRPRPTMSAAGRVRRGLVLLTARMVASVVAACGSPSNAPAPSGGLQARGSGPVRVLYAGTLVGILERRVGPAFEEATGYTFQAAKVGKRSFESVLTQPGLRFGRADPELGTKGYRTIFTFDLDAKRTGDPTLPQKILGGPDNSSQLFPEEQMVARLQAGELDSGAFYKVEAVEAGPRPRHGPPGRAAGRPGRWYWLRR